MTDARYCWQMCFFWLQNCAIIKGGAKLSILHTVLGPDNSSNSYCLKLLNPFVQLSSVIKMSLQTSYLFWKKKTGYGWDQNDKPMPNNFNHSLITTNSFWMISQRIHVWSCRQLQRHSLFYKSVHLLILFSVLCLHHELRLWLLSAWLSVGIPTADRKCEAEVGSAVQSILVYHRQG